MTIAGQKPTQVANGSSLLSRFHWNHLPECCSTRLCGGPQHRVGRSLTWECTAQVCKENQCLRHNSALVQPAKAGREVRSSSANRAKRDRLPCLIDLRPMDLGVEVEHMHAARSLSFEDGANLRLEES
jgi:hypothetical protein